MCDYSLHAQRNRLAVDGERLVVVRFPGGSQGMMAESEYTQTDTTRTKGFFRAWWNRIVTGDVTPSAAKPCATAVCIPPGARLVLKGFSDAAQEKLGVSRTEFVTFEQTSCDPYTYRDAVRFGNGKVVSLQALEQGLRAEVISLAPEAQGEEDTSTIGVGTKSADSRVSLV